MESSGALWPPSYHQSFNEVGRAVVWLEEQCRMSGGVQWQNIRYKGHSVRSSYSKELMNRYPAMGKVKAQLI